MGGSVPVFVQCDDPGMQAVVANALTCHGAMSVVDAPDQAWWIVVASSRCASPPPSGLSAREAAVLRLVALGYTTAEIGRELSYSERSIKNMIGAVTDRLALRNRCHAVAHAIREGWI